MTNTVQRALMSAAGAALALAASAAAADPILPGAVYSYESYPNGPNGSNPAQVIQVPNAGSVSTSTNNIDGVASGAASASSQFVSADASSSSYSNEGLGSASETYYFSVIGPQDVGVHLLISGSGHMYSTGGDGYVQVGENINNITNFGRTCSAGSDQCGDFSYSQSVFIASNTVAYLTLGIFALVQNGSNGGWIDPMITIDPNFAGADQFHLIFSDGITNGTGLAPTVDGVPEPASWALMITGFGLAGAGLRRRRTALFAA